MAGEWGTPVGPLLGSDRHNTGIPLREGSTIPGAFPWIRCGGSRPRSLSCFLSFLDSLGESRYSPNCIRGTPDRLAALFATPNHLPSRSNGGSVKLFAWIHSLAAKFVHRSEIAEQTEEELRFHIGSRADDLERSGLTRAEAERRARIEFGSYQKYREESHQALGGNFIETLLQDVRFAFRLLRKSPGFATTAILTLALAIGANAVVFGVLNALVLRPLDLPQADSLYGIEHGDEFGFQSWPNYLDLRDRNHSFDGLAVFSFTQEFLDTGNNPSHSWGYQTSSNYFDVLRIQPYLGRLFHPSDEHGLNSAPFVVLTYAFWHSHFQDDRGVIGRVVQLNKHPFTVVGVAPPGFHGTLQFFTPDFFMPIVNQGQVSGWRWSEGPRRTAGSSRYSDISSPESPPLQATTNLNSIGAYLEKTYPKNVSHKSFILARPSLYGSFLGGPISWVRCRLMLLASLILLAACANLGSLFAARAADRSREVALRLALGSSRNRILRQLMTEAPPHFPRRRSSRTYR